MDASIYADDTQLSVPVKGQIHPYFLKHFLSVTTGLFIIHNKIEHD